VLILATLATLPGAYFPLLEAGAAKAAKILDSAQPLTLAAIESRPATRHFPYMMLAPAVLYTSQHPANPGRGQKRHLDLAIRIGDLLADEDERGTFEPRGDSDWDTYMWLETWRLLGPQLGETRKARWRKAIERNIALLVRDATDRLDFPWYHSPFIGTSPNHYVQWATLLHLGGISFGRKDWQDLGTKILRRFALTEQSPGGFWGEHNRSGPTTGYNHLTLTGVALYWEHSRDPEVMPALRRAMDFHRNFTFLDGAAVDVINDRNRYWAVSAWGQFAFSHWPDGRGYAEFVASFFKPETIGTDVGRLAQSALYYHEGPSEPAPQLRTAYHHQIEEGAGIRKSGPWQVALSGIMSTQAINSRFYLDRQGHISVFHDKLGLIITGANSKRQPELATFSEKLMDQTVHMPITTRLQMGGPADRLSLAFHTFFSDLYIPAAKPDELTMRFVISGRGRPAEDPTLTLQLCLKPGELKTGAGAVVSVSKERLELRGEQLAGSVSHRGWTLHVDPSAKLVWPVYPHNPYSDQPETSIERAVAAVSVPLKLKSQPGRYVRANEQEIIFRLSTSASATPRAESAAPRNTDRGR